jgi:hypothetical protein
MVIEPTRGFDLILVIDALDECDKGERGTMLRKLLPSLSQAPLTKLFITSRSETDLVQHLDSYRSKTDSLHDPDLQSNQSDISIFVEDQMRSLVSSSVLTQRDVERLARRVSCLFILASTACKAIQDCIDHRIMIDTLLKPNSNPLNDINNLYEAILDKACRVSRVRGTMSSLGQLTILKVLKAVLFACEPLTVATIDALLGTGTTRQVVESLSSVLSVTKDGLVHMLHPTFREFLEDREVAGEFYVDKEDSHRMMAKGCLDIMKRQLQFNICRLKSSFNLNRDIEDLKERISKELRYGCMYWLDHISQGSATHDKNIKDALAHVLIGAYPLYWIEVMSALGSVPKAISSLQDFETMQLVSVRVKFPSTC